MDEKLRQITDTIHQTIYLSTLESDLMSTAYFYRLHDIYQSSTVYLTFPCNRTKRYEHSCGTMELAGEIFFSAITNAEDSKDIVLNSFFKTAEKELHEIIQHLLSEEKPISYCDTASKELKQCFPPCCNREISKRTDEIIKNIYKNQNAVEDLALKHYMPSFTEQQNSRKFLYQCILEAVRIVALFHDVGHPPYSHILEKTLSDLETECQNQDNKFNTKRANELLESLKQFHSDKFSNSCLISEGCTLDSALHERIGLKMLTGAFRCIYESKFKECVKNPNMELKSTIAVYYITIAEFCFAILREKDSWFTSLHRIIDGCIDADRMDYIMRDSTNSGVDWGKIPYKRLIDSCKLFQRTYDKCTFYPVAFAEKMSETIHDLLITRYKIFSRINYHHRCYKTGLLLQRIVYLLSEDYLLKNDKQKCLCENISDLWNCLASTLSSGDLYIIQWNDSSLISHLYHTLVEMKKSSAEYYDILPEHYQEISNMLEEFLLNRKHFYSIFKRQLDFVPIMQSAFQKLNPLLDKIKQHEQSNMNNTKQEIRNDAEDSIKRIDIRQLDRLIETGDIGVLERLFPGQCSIDEIIPQVLSDYHKQGKIGTYLYDRNKKRISTGLPQQEDGSDSIYLYGSTAEEAKVYVTSLLENQLASLQNNCLEYIAYVELKDENTAIIQEIRGEISNRLYLSLQEAITEMFSYLNTIK